MSELNYHELNDNQKAVVEKFSSYTGSLGLIAYGDMDTIKTLIDTGWMLVRKRKNGRNKYSSFYYRLSKAGHLAKG